MKLNTLKRAIRPLLNSGVSLELRSPPGVGKSDFVEQTIRLQSAADQRAENALAAKEQRQPENMDWGFSKLFLATQTPPDLIGYQFKGEREFDGKRVAVTEPTLPPWMMTVDGNPVTAYKRGILFLDEYGQGESDVKRASAELLLNRQLGPWRLPAGWSVIAASNRANDRSGVTKSFDFVINRRTEIEIEPDLEAWIEWADDNNVDYVFKSFVKQNPQVLFDATKKGIPDQQGPWATPRSLMLCAAQLLELGKVSQVTAANVDFSHVPVDDVAQEVAEGIIGPAAANQLFQHIRLGYDMPDYASIIMDPTRTPVPDRPDGRMLVSYNLAARVTTETLDACLVYVQRMPAEFSSSFAVAAVKRVPSFLRNPNFVKFVSANKQILSAFV